MAGLESGCSLRCTQVHSGALKCMQWAHAVGPCSGRMQRSWGRSWVKKPLWAGRPCLTGGSVEELLRRKRTMQARGGGRLAWGTAWLEERAGLGPCGAGWAHAAVFAPWAAGARGGACAHARASHEIARAQAAAKARQAQRLCSAAPTGWVPSLHGTPAPTPGLKWHEHAHASMRASCYGMGAAPWRAAAWAGARNVCCTASERAQPATGQAWAGKAATIPLAIRAARLPPCVTAAQFSNSN